MQFRCSAVAVASAAAVFMSVGTAFAGSITLTPGSGSPYEIDHANGNGSAAPGFGTGSFQAAAGAGQKSEIYIPVSSIFSGAVHVGDIASISYWTNKSGTGGDVDWTFLMYTKPTGSDDSAGWYKSRLNSEPYFTSSTVAPNTWHEWSTAPGTNSMRFYDQPRSGNFGTYTDPTLAGLTAGPVLVNGNWRDYRGEELNILSFQTGSAWANGFAGLLDGLTITLNDGSVGIVNFENTLTVVPLPGAAWAGISGLVGLAGFGSVRRRRLRA